MRAAQSSAGTGFMSSSSRSGAAPPGTLGKMHLTVKHNTLWDIMDYEKERGNFCFEILMVYHLS